MRRTAGDLQEMVDLAYALGAHGLTVLQMLPIGAGASPPRRTAAPTPTPAGARAPARRARRTARPAANPRRRRQLHRRPSRRPGLAQHHQRAAHRRAPSAARGRRPASSPAGTAPHERPTPTHSERQFRHDRILHMPCPAPTNRRFRLLAEAAAVRAHGQRRHRHRQRRLAPAQRHQRPPRRPRLPVTAKHNPTDAIYTAGHRPRHPRPELRSGRSPQRPAAPRHRPAGRRHLRQRRHLHRRASTLAPHLTGARASAPYACAATPAPASHPDLWVWDRRRLGVASRGSQPRPADTPTEACPFPNRWHPHDHVAFVLASWRPDVPAGMERAVAAHAAALADVGHNAIIVTADPAAPPTYRNVTIGQLHPRLSGTLPLRRRHPARRDPRHRPSASRPHWSRVFARERRATSRSTSTRCGDWADHAQPTPRSATFSPPTSSGTMLTSAPRWHATRRRSSRRPTTVLAQAIRTRLRQHPPGSVVPNTLLTGPSTAAARRPRTPAPARPHPGACPARTRRRASPSCSHARHRPRPAASRSPSQMPRSS